MIFVPIAVASLILLSLIRSISKKKLPPKRTLKQQQTDELITVILPILGKET